MSEITELDLPSWVAKMRDATRGPWFSSIKLALSNDGLHFEKTHRVLVDRGGVSNICMASEGRIIVSYQYFSFLHEKEFNKMAVSISSDDGKTWDGPIIMILNGLDKYRCIFPCDPTKVLLDDGRVRLYFTCVLHPNQGILSAEVVLSEQD